MLLSGVSASALHNLFLSLPTGLNHGSLPPSAYWLVWAHHQLSTSSKSSLSFPSLEEHSYTSVYLQLPHCWRCVHKSRATGSMGRAVSPMEAELGVARGWGPVLTCRLAAKKVISCCPQSKPSIRKRGCRDFLVLPDRPRPQQRSALRARWR